MHDSGRRCDHLPEETSKSRQVEGADPVYLGSLPGDVVWMEPPRREGGLYGEEFHLQEAREAVARLTGR